jgi:hypothetical protein
MTGLTNLEPKVKIIEAVASNVVTNVTFQVEK